MTKLSLTILILISIIGIFFYSGCSSSSGSVRYNNSSDKSSENTSEVRYGASNENKKSNDVEAIQNTDTTESYNDTSDSDSEDIPVNEKKIDVSSLLKKYSSDENVEKLTPEQTNAREKILIEIIKYLDTPYKYGGSTKDGIDCSAFTKAVYEKSLSVELLRSAREQFQEGEEVREKDNLKFGDLVFFNTRRKVKPGHVGIYIGDNLFAHASSKNGVIVSSLDETYYSKRFMGARRVENLSSSGDIPAGN